MDKNVGKPGLKEIILDKLMQEDEITLLELYKSLLEKRKSGEKVIEIPTSIFNCSLSPLECLVKYLKDNLGFSVEEIASKLNRNRGSIWLTYKNATSKKNDFKIDMKITVPLVVLGDRNYSVLENLVKFMKENLQIKVKNIALLIGKSEKTIYTVYSRMKVKRK